MSSKTQLAVFFALVLAFLAGCQQQRPTVSFEDNPYYKMGAQAADLLKSNPSEEYKVVIQFHDLTGRARSMFGAGFVNRHGKGGEEAFKRITQAADSTLYDDGKSMGAKLKAEQIQDYQVALYIGKSVIPMPDASQLGFVAGFVDGYGEGGIVMVRALWGGAAPRTRSAP